MLARIPRNWISHTMLEQCKMYSHLEKRFAVSYKTKHAFTVQPRNCSLGHLSQRNKSTQMLIAALSVIAKT